ncbi:unnamed protein product [Choristocarpus tenellus]
MWLCSRCFLSLDCCSVRKYPAPDMCAVNGLVLCNTGNSCIVVIVFILMPCTHCLSLQSLSLALCSATNMFGTPSGMSYMSEASVMPGWMDAALQGLQHKRGEVRQMSSALLNNYSLVIANALPSIAEGKDSDLPDEAAQILFGALDGLEEEKSETVALRRLLAVGRLLRKLGTPGVSLVNEVGFKEQVRRLGKW